MPISIAGPGNATENQKPWEKKNSLHIYVASNPVQTSPSAGTGIFLSSKLLKTNIYRNKFIELSLLETVKALKHF